MKHDTCPFYGQAETVTCQSIQMKLDSGTAKLHKDGGAEMLALVLDGFIASDYTKERIRNFIAEYRKAMKSKTP